MKLITVFFARKNKYYELLKVFNNSMRIVMPEIKFKLIKIKKPENIDHKRDTAFAFLAAAEYALKSNCLLAVADCDLMFLKSIKDIHNFEFDIAITTRNKMKYNTGLWFYRPNKRSQVFLKKWIANTKILMNNFCKYESFCWSHGGIDQASLYMTVEKNKKTKIIELPCQEWNATQTEWNSINENTRVIHIKSKLRSAIFNNTEIDPYGEYSFLIPLIKKWRSFL